ADFAGAFTTAVFFAAGALPDACLTGALALVAFDGAAFLAGTDLFGTGFFVATLLAAAAFFTGAFLTGTFLTGAFFGAAFFAAGAFLATGFFAAGFFAAWLAGAAFLAGVLPVDLTAFFADFFSATIGLSFIFPCDGKARCYTLPRHPRQPRTGSAERPARWFSRHSVRVHPGTTPVGPSWAARPHPGSDSPDDDRPPAHHAAARLQALDQSVARAALPVPPYLLRVRNAGGRSIRRGQGQLACAAAHPALPSAASRRP